MSKKKTAEVVKEAVKKAVSKVAPRTIENHSLKPRSISPEMELQNSIKTPTVTLISPHGKEVTVVTSMLAVHLERGFTIKD